MTRKQQEKRAREMYELYQAGHSLEQVGKAYGITRQSVFGIFKQRGFILRDKKPLPYIVFKGKKYTLDRDGYYRDTAHKIGIKNYLHQAVWEYHNGPIPEGYEIHHADEDKTNNSIENLECLTPSEHGLKHQPYHQIDNAPHCLYCGKLLERKIQPSGKIETPAELKRRQYCNTECHANHKRGKPKGWSARRDNI